jgi:hypothetical protein
MGAMSWPKPALPVRSHKQARQHQVPPLRPGKQALPIWRAPQPTTHNVTVDTSDPVLTTTSLPLQCMMMTPKFAPMVQAQGKQLMSCHHWHVLTSTHLWEHYRSGNGHTGRLRETMGIGDHRSGSGKMCTQVGKNTRVHCVDCQRCGIPGERWLHIGDHLGGLGCLRPKNLKVSPLAMVPQRNQRGRMLLDLSFAVQCGKTQ